nr:S-layer homology domain-containing protein [Thermoclostridium sp.]
MKRRMRTIARVMVFVLLFMMNTVSGAAKTAKFPDVPDTAWYMDDLQYILKDTRKIFSGYPDGSFKPNDTLTVDMFIKLIVTVMGHQVENGKEYWASTYIEKAMEEGYIVEHSYGHKSEISFNTYDKNDPYAGYKKPISRQEMAFLIGKALDKTTDESAYRDLLAVIGLIKDYRSIPGFYCMNIVKCYDLGIITGYPDGEFKPYNILTRAEAVAVIRRLLDPSARKRMPLPVVANPSPTPIPVAQLNRPAKKDLGNGVVEVEGVSFDPAQNIINKQNGAMHILKAQEYLGVFLEYLTFYEYEGKARVKGYIPELPENYYWSLSI